MRTPPNLIVWEEHLDWQDATVMLGGTCVHVEVRQREFADNWEWRIFDESCTSTAAFGVCRTRRSAVRAVEKVVAGTNPNATRAVERSIETAPVLVVS